jgi:hypothetical protein
VGYYQAVDVVTVSLSRHTHGQYLGPMGTLYPRFSLLNCITQLFLATDFFTAFAEAVEKKQD